MAKAKRVSHGHAPIDAEAIRKFFRLEGEDLVRIPTGKVIEPPAGWPPNVYVCKIGRSSRHAMYHRVKFCLLHGYLPPEVDHRDGDSTNHANDNLRPATRAQQNRNKPNRKRRDLPRGVFKGSKRKPFRGRITHEGKPIDLGWFNTPEEASLVIEAKLRELHGEFYCP